MDFFFFFFYFFPDDVNDRQVPSGKSKVQVFQNGSFSFMQLLNHVHSGQPCHWWLFFFPPAICKGSWVLIVLDARPSPLTSATMIAWAEATALWSRVRKEQQHNFPLVFFLWVFLLAMLCNFVLFWSGIIAFFLCLYLKGIWSPAESQKFSEVVFVQGGVSPQIEVENVTNFSHVLYAGTFLSFFDSTAAQQFEHKN